MDIQLVGSEQFRKRLNSMKLTPQKRNIAIGKSLTTMKNHLKRLFDEELETSSIKNKVFDELTHTGGRLYTNQLYAIFLEHGTKPHEILPRRRKALSWYVGPKPKPAGYLANKDMWAVAKRVWHPGTKGRFFFKRTLEENEERILQIFKNEVEKDV